MDCSTCMFLDVECNSQCVETCAYGVAPEDCKRAIFEECVSCPTYQKLKEVEQCQTQC